jgi:hypothetical protein
MINRRKQGGAFALESRKCRATHVLRGCRIDVLAGGITELYPSKGPSVYAPENLVP